MELECNELERAYTLMNAGNYQDTVSVLLAYLKDSPQDYEAQFLLARAYSSMSNFANSFVWCKKAADEGKIPAAQALLALHYCEGVGVKKSGPDASYYVKMAIEANDPEAWNSIHLCQGLMYWEGLGVDKDVTKAYRHFKEVQGIELADEYAKAIEEFYPINNEGKIDLKKRKRSKWATFFLWMAILINLILLSTNITAYSVGESSMITLVVNAILVIFPFGVLFWQRWAFWGMVAVLLLSFPVEIFHIMDGKMENLFGLPFLLSVTPSLYFLPLMTLFIHKKGYCQPLYALMGKEDTGCHPTRRALNRLLCYGEGEAYKIDASRTKMFSIYHYLGMALISVLAVCGAWGVAQNRFGLELEWNIFNSTSMWTFFSIIGFFLQFLDWTHMSFERGTLSTKPDGQNEFNPSDDIMDKMEGSFLWPLICHLFLIPAMYGAMIYYALMGGLALIGGIMPYVLALIVLGSVYFYYKWGVLLRQRKYRVGMLMAMSVLFALVYINLAGNISLDFGIGSGEATAVETRFVRCTGNKVNLREYPDAKSARLYEAANCFGDLYFKNEAEEYDSPMQLSDTDIVPVLAEEGDWYKLSIRGLSAYAMKKFFVTIPPSNLDEGIRNNVWMQLVQRTSGKYKGCWLYYEEDAMGGVTTFYLGKKQKEGILFFRQANCSWDSSLIKVNENTGDAIYNGCLMTIVDGREKIDLKGTSDEFFKSVFEMGEDCHIGVHYFGETNRFVWSYSEYN